MVGRELRKRIARVFLDRDIRSPVAQMNVNVNGLEQLLAATQRPAGADQRD
jgi:hypothetical protein